MASNITPATTKPNWGSDIKRSVELYKRYAGITGKLPAAQRGALASFTYPVRGKTN